MSKLIRFLSSLLFPLLMTLVAVVSGSYIMAQVCQGGEPSKEPVFTSRVPGVVGEGVDQKYVMTIVGDEFVITWGPTPTPSWSTEGGCGLLEGSGSATLVQGGANTRTVTEEVCPLRSWQMGSSPATSRSRCGWYWANRHHGPDPDRHWDNCSSEVLECGIAELQCR